MFDVVAFDADDTLWHNETLYHASQESFYALVSPYASREQAEQALYQTEMGNLKYFGYGIKSFVLSMVECGIRLSDGEMPGSQLQKIIDLGKGMMQAQVTLFDHVEDVVRRLSQTFRLMLVTKGDLLDQESKVARSGLGSYFWHVEIVSEQSPASYAALLERSHLSAERFIMVGNSLRSDILPVLELGGWAVYIPYHLTWKHENEIEQDPGNERFFEIEHIGLLPELLERIKDHD